MIEINSNEPEIKSEMEYDLDELLSFFERFYNKLKNNQQVLLIENEKFKEYSRNVRKLHSESKMSEESLKIQELKSLNEKILGSVCNRKEFEFVSDYFVVNSQNNTNYTDEVMNTEENNIDQDDEEGNLDYNILENLPDNFNISEKKHFFELLPLASNEFLKDKLHYSEEEIIKLKGEVGLLDKKRDEEIAKVPEIVTSSPNRAKNLLESLKIDPVKSRNSNTKDLFHPKPAVISKIDKEVEEEINNEIFSYTKNMKHYAQSFNQILTHDNKKLDKIERNQEVGKNKTDRSVKGLNEFNYTIKIGFWKLLLMFLIVGISFITVLICIRIFPKLVK